MMRLLQPEETGVSFTNTLYESTELNIITFEYLYNGAGVAVGDINDDGLADLYFSGNMVPGRLYLNRGDLHFEEVTEQAGIDTRGKWGTGVSMVDVNADGRLDLYLCFSGPYTAEVRKNMLYINNGDGTFTFHQGDIGDYPSGGNYGSVWVDYDNDGDMDCFIAKCNVNGDVNERSENQLYQNDGAGNFVEVAETAGLKDNMQTWSSAWADFDNDGHLDVFVGSSSANFTHKLNRNNGDGTFTDISASTGIHALTTTGIENCTYDFNNDGYADIASNGNILLNNGDLTFTLIPLALPNNNGSLGDLNNDGFIDSFTGGQIYYNDGNSNHWITINTIGVESNINGIGARVTITSALGTQIREVRSGEGFKYMSTLNTHFGLGQDTEIATLTIAWPSGIVDTLENVAVDQVISVVEGSTVLGLNESVTNNLILYPNPAQHILNLGDTTDFTNPSYSIFDMQGRKLMGAPLDANAIDVSTLATGNYILKIQDGNTLKSQRFIKK
ncbi:MAG: VCBS repeat-containing protein [Lewinella sp.]|nr:VCBS repeat-containing protein [Lewinella sp.]